MTPGATVLQGGRRKAFRPLPRRERNRALAAGLDAYRRGDFFLAHEILEPAWMGTDDPLERELHQGLIKLAAAYVHGARGNPVGLRKNLVGARERLAAVVDGSGPTGGLDLAALLAAIDERLARSADASPPDAAPTLDPPVLAGRPRRKEPR
jgi:predicted metal-dependent hydrolase